MTLSQRPRRKPRGGAPGAASTAAAAPRQAAASSAAAPASGAAAPTSPRSPQPAGEGARERGGPVTQKEWLERYARRADDRNAEARARLVPLAPGERPWPILAGVLLSGGAAAVNLVLWLIGTKIGGKSPNPAEMVAFTIIMGICAIGMWVLWYQAVLAFMVLLAIVVVMFSLFLVEASNLLGILVPLLFIGGGGYLFWKLVRVLARLQMPTRPTRSPGR